MDGRRIWRETGYSGRYSGDARCKDNLNRIYLQKIAEFIPFQESRLRVVILWSKYQGASGKSRSGGGQKDVLLEKRLPIAMNISEKTRESSLWTNENIGKIFWYVIWPDVCWQEGMEIAEFKRYL